MATHPARLLVLLGTVASACVVVGATRAGPVAGVVLPDGPLGSWRAAASGRSAFAALAVAGMCGLVVVFVRLYRLAAADVIGVPAVARAAVAWALPLLPGQPLMSLDAYSYVAQGWMLVRDLNPYAGGPVALGTGPVLDAVSPVWRETAAPYGPLAMAMLRETVKVGGATPVGTVYLLRLLAVLAVVATSVLTLRLVQPDRRAAALALVAANPLVIVHLIGGVHFDALLAGLAALAVFAVRRQRWVIAALVAATALAIKLPGLILVGYVLLARLRAGDPLWRRLAGTVQVGLVALAGTAGYAALIPNGWGWLGALGVPGKVWHFYDPAIVLSWLLHSFAGLPVVSAVPTARTLTAVAAAAGVLVLLWRAGRESAPALPGPPLGGGSGRAAALVGAGLATVALAAPTVHAWYLVWGLALVAAGAGAQGHQWLLALSAALCFTALPDRLLHSTKGLVLIGVALCVALVGVLPRRTPWPVRAPAEPRDEPTLAGP